VRSLAWLLLVATLAGSGLNGLALYAAHQQQEARDSLAARADSLAARADTLYRQARQADRASAFYNARLIRAEGERDQCRAQF
jgi:hypothetical protein